MSDFNPALKPSDAGPQGSRGGSIESTETIRNIPWQTRAAAPSAYEAALADALMAAFDDGASDLPSLVARLDAARVQAPDGSAWREAALAAALARLGV